MANEPSGAPTGIFPRAALGFLTGGLTAAQVSQVLKNYPHPDELQTNSNSGESIFWYAVIPNGHLRGSHEENA